MFISLLFILGLMLMIAYRKRYGYLFLPLLTTAYLFIPMILINIFGVPISTSIFTVSKDIVLFMLLIMALYTIYSENDMNIPKDNLHIYLTMLFYVLILFFVFMQPFIYRLQSSLMYFYIFLV